MAGRLLEAAISDRCTERYKHLYPANKKSEYMRKTRSSIVLGGRGRRKPSTFGMQPHVERLLAYRTA